MPIMTTATTASMMTTNPDWAEEAVCVHALRLAVWEWRVDPVGGRTRLVKDIAREHSAPDPVMTHVYLSISSGLRPNALAFQDLDSYVAAWRDTLFKELCAYKAAALYCTQVIRAHLRAEARFPAPRRASFLAEWPPRRITRRAPFACGGATPSVWRAIGLCFEPAAGRLFYY
jgi:hypothetical protein